MEKQVVFVMGVSGSGKSTVGELLAKKLAIPFFDADDFHPKANVDKMKSGKPLNDEDRAPWLANLNALAKESLHEIRTISHGLHPATLRQAGISTAITSMVHQLDTNTDIFFTLNIDNIDGILNPEQERHLYRIIQESLNNIVKHSGAKASSIKVEKKANTIYAIVSDNGKGYDVEKNSKGLGTKNIETRVQYLKGVYKVKSQLKKGTFNMFLFKN